MRRPGVAFPDGETADVDARQSGRSRCGRSGPPGPGVDQQGAATRGPGGQVELGDRGQTLQRYAHLTSPVRHGEVRTGQPVDRHLAQVHPAATAVGGGHAEPGADRVRWHHDPQGQRVTADPRGPRRSQRHGLARCGPVHRDGVPARLVRQPGERHEVRRRAVCAGRAGRPAAGSSWTCSHSRPPVTVRDFVRDHGRGAGGADRVAEHAGRVGGRRPDAGAVEQRPDPVVAARRRAGRRPRCRWRRRCCCCGAVSRVGVPGEHTGSPVAPHEVVEGGRDRLARGPLGVEVVVVRADHVQRAVQGPARLTPRVASMNIWPCRSETSPSQPGRIVADGTSGAGFCPKIVGPISSIPRIVPADLAVVAVLRGGRRGEAVQGGPVDALAAAGVSHQEHPGQVGARGPPGRPPGRWRDRRRPSPPSAPGACGPATSGPGRRRPRPGSPGR